MTQTNLETILSNLETDKARANAIKQLIRERNRVNESIDSKRAKNREIPEDYLLPRPEIPERFLESTLQYFIKEKEFIDSAEILMYMGMNDKAVELLENNGNGVFALIFAKKSKWGADKINPLALRTIQKFAKEGRYDASARIATENGLKDEADKYFFLEINRYLKHGSLKNASEFASEFGKTDDQKFKKIMAKKRIEICERNNDYWTAARIAHENNMTNITRRLDNEYVNQVISNGEFVEAIYYAKEKGLDEKLICTENIDKIIKLEKFGEAINGANLAGLESLADKAYQLGLEWAFRNSIPGHKIDLAVEVGRIDDAITFAIEQKQEQYAIKIAKNANKKPEDIIDLCLKCNDVEGAITVAKENSLNENVFSICENAGHFVEAFEYATEMRGQYRDFAKGTRNSAEKVDFQKKSKYFEEKTDYLADRAISECENKLDYRCALWIASYSKRVEKETRLKELIEAMSF